MKQKTKWNNLIRKTSKYWLDISVKALKGGKVRDVEVSYIMNITVR